MPIRDFGAVPDYLDKAMAEMEAQAIIRDDPKGELGKVFATRRVANADLKAIQANRPLKPPGKGGDFSFQSPMCRAVLFERAQAEENRRRA